MSHIPYTCDRSCDKSAVNEHNEKREEHSFTNQRSGFAWLLLVQLALCKASLVLFSEDPEPMKPTKITSLSPPQLSVFLLIRSITCRRV